ncbi:MAG: NADH-quinone oxidoreductase subunit L, partial [Alicyclobacillus sp.]|nr:NADH-quinone oxidoreductase subunit L [Alicyclobacillus sp.]
AYSTISQLGYMMMALGVGAYAYGVFHLMTHAFFKALLFLAAGSVIHALDTQDLFEMGGLARKMPVTTWTFFAGALALAGIVPFAGFWSKDDILTATLQGGHPVLYLFGLVAAFCTAFYIFRVFFLTFTGEPRSPEKYAHAHEGSWVMTLPLLALGVLSTVGGFFNTPLNGYGLERYLFRDAALYDVAHTGWGGPPFVIGRTYPENAGLLALSVVIGLAGIALAAAMYWRPVIRPSRVAEALSLPYRISFRKFYLDEAYYGLLVQTGKGLARVLDVIDRYIIDGIVQLVSRLVYIAGVGLKYTQTGQVQTYGAVAMVGLFVILAIAMIGAGGVF